MNSYEHERRNRRLTVLLIVTFVLLFAALGGGLDVAVAGFGIGGSSLPYLAIGAVLVSLGIAGLGYRRGTDWVMRSPFGRAAHALAAGRSPDDAAIALTTGAQRRIAAARGGLWRGGEVVDRRQPRCGHPRGRRR